MRIQTKLLARWDEIVADYLERIRLTQPAGPYYLLGWSFGGVLAHALAVELQALGERVALLALLDAYPGHRLEKARDEREALAKFARDFGLNDTDLISREATLEAVSRGGPLAHLDNSILHRILATYINTSQIGFNQIPGCFYGDVLLFVATLDRKDTSPIGDMSPYVQGKIIEYPINARHSEMTDPGPLREIGKILAQHLDSLTPSYPTVESL